MICKVRLVTLGTLLLLCVSCYSQVGTQRVVDLGFRGILINENGGISSETVYKPGGYFINSKDSLLLFPVSQREFLVNGSIMTKDREILKVNFKVSYKPNVNDLLKLYERFGLEYEKYLINQESMRSARDVTSLMSRESIYDDDFKSLEAQILIRLKKAFERNYIDLTGLYELSVFEEK